jgi:hypothetical protein
VLPSWVGLARKILDQAEKSCLLFLFMTMSNDDKMFNDINTRLVADVKKKEEELRKLQVRPGNTKGGSITVPLTSCLTGTNLNGTI